MIPAVVGAVAVVMILVETLGHGRSWPTVRGWWARAVLLNGTEVGIALASALLWDRWFAAVRPWSAEGLAAR